MALPSGSAWIAFFQENWAFLKRLACVSLFVKSIMLPWAEHQHQLTKIGTTLIRLNRKMSSMVNLMIKSHQAPSTSCSSSTSYSFFSSSFETFAFLAIVVIAFHGGHPHFWKFLYTFSELWCTCNTATSVHWPVGQLVSHLHFQSLSTAFCITDPATQRPLVLHCHHHTAIHFK